MKSRLAIAIVALLVGLWVQPAEAADQTDCFTSDPVGLDFGVVHVGEQKELSVTFTNLCGRTAHVTGVGARSRGEFGLGSAETCYGNWIPPDETCIESATFAPFQAGAARGFLNIYNGGQDRLGSVPLRGEST
jgi:hypothetical protein